MRNRCAIGSVIAALVLASCGGNVPDERQTGGVRLIFHWPQTREIPEAARSIKVVAQVLQPPDGPIVATEVVARPENQPSSKSCWKAFPA